MKPVAKRISWKRGDETHKAHYQRVVRSGARGVDMKKKWRAGLLAVLFTVLGGAIGVPVAPHVAVMLGTAADTAIDEAMQE